MFEWFLVIHSYFIYLNASLVLDVQWYISISKEGQMENPSREFSPSLIQGIL